MSFYADVVFPRILNLSMRSRHVTRWRARVVPAARGRVLEIGIGSGLNLGFYGRGVEALCGVDPADRLLAMAGKAARDAPFAVDLLRRGAEALPFDAKSFDSVVTTWTLCSIPDVSSALTEMRRVLKPGGELIFIEHGLAPEPRVAAWQRRLGPLWRRCSGGCHLERKMDELIRHAGFAITHLDTGYLVPGPRPLTYSYRGRARCD
jgi:SAM-dependent methyltransferase